MLSLKQINYYDDKKRLKNDAILLNNSLMQYKDDFYMPINTSLRNNKIGSSILQKIKNIIDIINNEGTPLNNLTVYRGVTSQYVEFKNMKKNDIIIDNGFLSCCRSLKGASSFSNIILQLTWVDKMNFINFQSEDKIITLPMVIITCTNERKEIINGRITLVKECTIISNYSDEKLNNMFDAKLEEKLTDDILENSEYYMDFLKDNNYNIVDMSTVKYTESI